MIDDYRESVCHLSFLLWYHDDDVKHVDDMYIQTDSLLLIEREKSMIGVYLFFLFLSLG